MKMPKKYTFDIVGKFTNICRSMCICVCSALYYQLTHFCCDSLHAIIFAVSNCISRKFGLLLGLIA